VVEGKTYGHSQRGTNTNTRPGTARRPACTLLFLGAGFQGKPPANVALASRHRASRTNSKKSSAAVMLWMFAMIALTEPRDAHAATEVNADVTPTVNR